MDMEAGKTLTNEEVIRELLDLLKKNAMKEQANDVFEICSYVDGLEKKIDSMTEELTNMQNQIKEMQEDTFVNNAKKALSEAKERLNTRCEQIKSQVLEVKAQVKSTAKSIVDEAKAKGSGLPEDAQAVSDLSSLCNRFEKKIHDLELTRAVSLQMAPQIRLVQSNDTLMSEKIQSTIVNTIPLWKSQMVLAIGVENSAKAAKAQREVTDVTNALLRKNAETLKMATIETAKETERGIVDMETLKATNESLIATLDEVMKIQTEGKEKRRAAEVELNRMEGELKQKLLEIH